MHPAIVFPSETERLERDLAEIEGHTLDQRIQALLDVSRLCEELRQASPTAGRQLQLLEERERGENARWRELIGSHA